MKITNTTNAKAKTIIKEAKKLLKRSTTRNFPCVTLWSDLLGFGQHLENPNLDFFEKQLKSNIGLKRIAVFHEASIQSMAAFYTIVQLNDATIFSVDLKKGKEEEILTEFLARVDLFWEIANIADLKIGGFGIRGVVSIGNRYNLRANLGWDGKNKPKENPDFICPEPIMMNMPFGKSYIVESSGVLRKEASLYVENEIFNKYNFNRMETWQIHEVVNHKLMGFYTMVRHLNE